MSATSTKQGVRTAETAGNCIKKELDTLKADLANRLPLKEEFAASSEFQAYSKAYEPISKEIVEHAKEEVKLNESGKNVDEKKAELVKQDPGANASKEAVDSWNTKVRAFNSDVVAPHNKLAKNYYDKEKELSDKLAKELKPLWDTAKSKFDKLEENLQNTQAKVKKLQEDYHVLAVFWDAYLTRLETKYQDNAFTGGRRKIGFGETEIVATVTDLDKEFERLKAKSNVNFDGSKQPDN